MLYKIILSKIFIEKGDLMAKAEYRSAIRSKNFIKKAVVKLMREKEISKITVSDIIREADISRGTFYAHYTDIESVIEQIETEELEKLLSFIDAIKDSESKKNTVFFIRSICEYLARDKDYYKMLTQTNIIHNFIHRLINIYYEQTIAQIIESGENISHIDANVFLTFTSTGASMVIISWLNGDIQGSPKEISERLASLIDTSKTYKDISI